MKVTSPKDLPQESACNICGNTKPLDQIVVIFHRKAKYYYVRPRCKECHNAAERGKRRDYKTEYLRKWRAKNKKLNRTYWDNEDVKQAAAARYLQRKNSPDFKQKNALKSAERFTRDSMIKAIQRRFSANNIEISFAEAAEYLDQFGCYYPTRKGLTKKGLDECERIRSTMRRRGMKRFDIFQIRLSVYEDSVENTSFLISPKQQELNYRSSSHNSLPIKTTSARIFI